MAYCRLYEEYLQLILPKNLRLFKPQSKIILPDRIDDRGKPCLFRSLAKQASPLFLELAV